MSRRIVGRLAPSPTGGLHLGHARTFLAAWLASRSSGGRILLRIEDIDASRNRPEAAAGMIADLTWLGLDWDEGPICQSSRLPIYEQALLVLQKHEAVYPCTCTRAEIARAASAPHPGEEGPPYPGTCAGRTVAEARNLQVPYCWRFRAADRDVVWEDLVAGPVAINVARTGGDFIVSRSQGQPSYQLAVVCDDALMGINQVVRGDDLIPSTPRQILLYEALGWQAPEFAHLPLVHDRDGKRLAKRDASIKIATLRERGVDPGTLLARLGESLGLPTTQNPEERLRAFRFDRIPRSPWKVPPLPIFGQDLP